jgi:hypothetical protein
MPIFAMSHLAHHILDELSPIYGKSLADLAYLRAEFFVQIFGTDAGYEQTVHVCNECSEEIKEKRRGGREAKVSPIYSKSLIGLVMS